MDILSEDEERLVIKLSGSLFSPSGEESRSITGIARALEEVHEKGPRIIAVAGGGVVARQYISLGRSLGGDESSLDQIGIDVSRLNARMMILSSKRSYPGVPRSLEEIVMALESGEIIFTGGLSPGHSTNATAALMAERTRAKLFINATDVDGVYSSDPRKGKEEAKLLNKVTTHELRRMLDDEFMQAGTYELMDLVALKIIERSRIPSRIVRCDPKVIKDAALGMDVGTLIVSGGK